MCAMYDRSIAFGITGEIGMEKFRVAAKANPWYKDPQTHDFFQPTHGLRPESVKEQLRHSLQTLG